MRGKTLILAGAAFMAVFVVVLWYTQFYAFYNEMPPASEITVADRTIEVQGFQGVDAETSPLKLRACMTSDPAAYAGLEPAVEPVPLVAPYWFDCFDAKTIARAIDAGTARAYLAATGEYHGAERMVAVFDDGRTYMWRQLSPEFAK